MIQQSLYAKYTGSPHNDIFKKMKDESLILENEIKVYAPTPYRPNTFCGTTLPHWNSYYIIDGDNETVWANDVYGEAFFIIDFNKNNILLESYTISWPCLKGNNWIIEGSNNNQTWFVVDNVTKFSSTSMTYHRKCRNPSTFRYFKISTEEDRIHISDVELFGVLNPNARRCTIIVKNKKGNIP